MLLWTISIPISATSAFSTCTWNCVRDFRPNVFYLQLSRFEYAPFGCACMRMGLCVSKKEIRRLICIKKKIPLKKPAYGLSLRISLRPRIYLPESQYLSFLNLSCLKLEKLVLKILFDFFFLFSVICIAQPPAATTYCYCLAHAITQLLKIFLIGELLMICLNKFLKWIQIWSNLIPNKKLVLTIRIQNKNAANGLIKKESTHCCIQTRTQQIHFIPAYK